MAETAANDAAQRYAAIEQAYSKEDWTAVLRDGEELLQQLGTAGDPQLTGLGMRLQLLMGHTQLYGLADKAAAAEFYRAVASQSGEDALARIAEQGLAACTDVETPAAATEPDPMTAKSEEGAGPGSAPMASPFGAVPATLELASPAAGGTTGPAAPWLTEATPPPTTAPATTAIPAAAPAPTPSLEPAAPAIQAAAAAMDSPAAESLIPDVVEEPELIELHQADPSLAEEVELAWEAPDPAPALSQEDEELLNGLLLVRIG